MMIIFSIISITFILGKSRKGKNYFDKDEYYKALYTFNQRDRRYGDAKA